MKQKKYTKRALCMSVLSMLLCCSMLVGTTFAWFTDSVTSGKNQIVAGNLDVELEYAPAGTEMTDGKIADTDWQKVTADVNLFKPAEGDGATLWEPGHTEYVYLRVRNAGSLALKYSLTANAFGSDDGKTPEKEYTSVETDASGEHTKFKLSEYLVFRAVEGTKAYTDRSELWLTDPAEEAATMGKLDGIGTTGEVLYPAAKADADHVSERIFTLAVYMPTSVGNAANQLTSAKATEGEPTVYLGLTLNATQTPYEEDSFDDQYDKKAEGLLIKGDYYATTPSEFTNDLNTAKPGETVVLRDDIDIDKSGAAITGSDIHLNLAGNAIVRSSNSGNALKIGSEHEPAKDVVIENGQFISEEGGNLVRIEYGGSSMTFRDCDFICKSEGSTGNDLIYNYNPDYSLTKITFENCTFDKGFIELKGEVDLTFINCKFNWEDENGSHFVSLSTKPSGKMSFDNCTFNYTHWWSGDLIDISWLDDDATMDVFLKDITVTGTGDRTPYVVSSSTPRQTTLTVTGTNSYMKDGVEKWSSYEKDWK